MIYNTVYVISLACALLLLLVACEDWTHYTVLDGKGKYHLYWKLPDDIRADSEIVFQTEVEAKGYVGFGLSPNGGMAGSDIITGWIKNGEVYFQVRIIFKSLFAVKLTCISLILMCA